MTKLDKPLVIFVSGPAGVGKTSVATELANKLSCQYLEGDGIHPKENVEKMAQGHPLTDEDRWGWLVNVAKLASDAAEQDSSKISVTTCSALKAKYRKFLVEKCPDNVSVVFAFLYAPEAELVRRAEARQNHYMKSNMVHSQIMDMEVPKDDELLTNGGHCIPIESNKPSHLIVEDLYTEVDNDVKVPPMVEV